MFLGLRAREQVFGHEQEGTARTCLVISDGEILTARSGLCVIVPITSSPPLSHVLQPATRPLADHLQAGSFLCDQVRTVSLERIRSYVGRISSDSLHEVESVLRDVLGL